MNLRLSAALILGALFLAPSLRAEETSRGPTATESGSQPVRLLTIGNSFSANATHYLGDLARAGGHELIHRPIVVGGASLQVHADKAQKAESDPGARDGLYSNGKSLKQLLQSDRWDYVTIQQASIKSHDISTYRPYAPGLRDYIRKYAPQAGLMIHETWAYRRDDPRFSGKSSKPGEPTTQQTMYDQLRSAYRTIAAELGARLIPVGDAFQHAHNDPRWGFKPDLTFNPKTATAPALPDQTHSLHQGWKWKNGKDGKPALLMDGHHANMAGEYLGACVFFEVLFHESAVGNRFIPTGLDPDFARYLQETAHAAVEGAAAETPKAHAASSLR